VFFNSQISKGIDMWKVINANDIVEYNTTRSYWEAVCLKNDVEKEQQISCWIVNCDVEYEHLDNKSLEELGGLFNTNASWKNTGDKIPDGCTISFWLNKNRTGIGVDVKNSVYDNVAGITLEFDNACNVRRHLIYVKDRRKSVMNKKCLIAINNYLVSNGYVVKPSKYELAREEISIWNGNINL